MKILSYFKKYFPFLLLGTALIFSLCALAFFIHFDTARLNAFGPTARIYFLAMKNGVLYASAILAIALTALFFFRNHLTSIQDRIENFFSSFTIKKQHLLIFGLCFLFTFTSHASNIMSGYFNMDDFIVINQIHALPFSKAVITPYGNDHLIPLFKIEMKVLDSLFGQNPAPYNFFVFLIFVFIAFFTYLIFRKLQLSLKGFFVFFILFIGATSWADMLSGFYIMSIYPQILLFFTTALWSYLSWVQSRQKKYLAILTLSIIFASLADTSGIWTIPATLLFMIIFYYSTLTSFTLQWRNCVDFLKTNSLPVLSVLIAGVLYGAFFYVSFAIIQPNTFLTTLGAEGGAGLTSIEEKKMSWRPLPLAKNFVSFASNGVSLSLFAPNAVKILVHPALQQKTQPFWPFVEGLVFIGTLLLLYLICTRADMREKKFLFFLFVAIGITVAMVIVARPNHEIIPDFDYRYVGAPFYFYCIILAIGASHVIRIKKENFATIIVPLVIVLFSAQQAFGFQAVRIKEESTLRKDAIIALDKGLISELRLLHTIPNLSGGHIFQPMSGLTLANYLLFFTPRPDITLIQNTAMPPDSGTHTVSTVESLRSSISKEFKEALLTPSLVRSYYTSPSLLWYSTTKISTSDPAIKIPKTTGEISIQKNQFDPEKKHRVHFILSTENVSGNLELWFSFKNDFNATGPMGKIRIDDYTPHTTINNRRIYEINTDLLQIYTFALSRLISDLTLFIPDTKNATVTDILFQ